MTDELDMAERDADDGTLVRGAAPRPLDVPMPHPQGDHPTVIGEIDYTPTILPAQLTKGKS